jgi:hypothetical protein
MTREGHARMRINRGRKRAFWAQLTYPRLTWMDCSPPSLPRTGVCAKSANFSKGPRLFLGLVPVVWPSARPRQLSTQVEVSAEKAE